LTKGILLKKVLGRAKGFTQRGSLGPIFSFLPFFSSLKGEKVWPFMGMWTLHRGGYKKFLGEQEYSPPECPRGFLIAPGEQFGSKATFYYRYISLSQEISGV